MNNITKPAIILVATGELFLLGARLVDLFELGSVPMNTFYATISNHTHIPEKLQKSFPEVFNGTRLCTKAQIRLQLKEKSRPVFRPKPPVAYAMHAVVDDKLEPLEKVKIITPVKTPTGPFRSSSRRRTCWDREKMIVNDVRN